MSPYPSFGFVTPRNMGLLVDLYELVMADSYLRQGMNQPATFDLFIRQLPPHRSFLVSAGLEAAQFYLEQLRFDDDAIAYLGSLNLFSGAFLEYLRKFRFTGDVRAIPEGEIFFPLEPLMEVTAPRIEAQLVETFLLNTMNFQTMVASKTARIVLASRGRGVVDFSPRRDHGADAAMKAARVSYIAGCVGTSNVLAGKEYRIQVFGTIAHSYIMSFSDELSAFRAYARDFPHNAVLLIDTYDTVQGARHAATVAREMAKRGQKLRGVRIDSGDHAALSRQVRAVLDEAGLRDVQIFLTGELDEYKIERLLNAGAAADSFGVGTELGTSGDAPSIGGVYKLVEDERGHAACRASPRSRAHRRRHHTPGRSCGDARPLRAAPQNPSPRVHGPVQNPGIPGYAQPETRSAPQRNVRTGRTHRAWLRDGGTLVRGSGNRLRSDLVTDPFDQGAPSLKRNLFEEKPRCGGPGQRGRVAESLHSRLPRPRFRSPTPRFQGSSCLITK